MLKMLPPPSSPANVGEVVRYVGRRLPEIDPVRIRLDPRPGTATEADLIAVNDGGVGVSCELVDGTLVEKIMGMEEGDVGGELFGFLRDHVRPRKIGRVLPSEAMFRLTGGLVRLPDVSFVSAAKYRAWRKDKPSIADFGPDLAVEILSKSNRRAEIDRKLREYFAAGSTLVWVVNPRRRTVAVHTSPTAFVRLTEADTLTGGTVLPGFSLPLAELFADPLGD